MATNRVGVFFFEDLATLVNATQQTQGVQVGDRAYVAQTNRVYINIQNQAPPQWETTQVQEPNTVEIPDDSAVFSLAFGERGFYKDSNTPITISLPEIFQDPSLLPGFKGSRVGIFFINGNSLSDTTIQADGGITIIWPDGVTGDRTFTAGDIAAGTSFQWEAQLDLEGNPIYVVDGTNVIGGGGPTTIPQWPQTLAEDPNQTGRTPGGGQFTDGVMPVLQESFPDDPSNTTKDQIHFYYPEGNTANNSPSASVDLNNTTAAYQIAIYATGLNGGDGVPQDIARIALNPGQLFQSLIQVQVVLRREGLPGGDDTIPYFLRGFYQNTAPGTEIIAVFEENGLPSTIDQFELVSNAGDLLLRWLNPLNDDPFSWQCHGISIVTSAINILV